MPFWGFEKVNSNSALFRYQSIDCHELQQQFVSQPVDHVLLRCLRIHEKHDIKSNSGFEPLKIA